MELAFDYRHGFFCIIDKRRRIHPLKNKKVKAQGAIEEVVPIEENLLYGINIDQTGHY